MAAFGMRFGAMDGAQAITMQGRMIIRPYGNQQYCSIACATSAPISSASRPEIW